MNKARDAISNFLVKDGKHNTTVHEVRTHARVPIDRS